MGRCAVLGGVLGAELREEERRAHCCSESISPSGALRETIIHPEPSVSHVLPAHTHTKEKCCIKTNKHTSLCCQLLRFGSAMSAVFFFFSLDACVCVSEAFGLAQDFPLSTAMMRRPPPPLLLLSFSLSLCANTPGTHRVLSLLFCPV